MSTHERRLKRGQKKDRLLTNTQEDFLNWFSFISIYFYFLLKTCFFELFAARTSSPNSSADAFRDMDVAIDQEIVFNASSSSSTHSMESLFRALLQTSIETVIAALIVLPYWRKLINRPLFLPISMFPMRRFLLKTNKAEAADDSGRKSAQKRKLPFLNFRRTSLDVPSSREKNRTGKSDRANVDLEEDYEKLRKVEGMSVLFSRELAQFVNQHKSEVFTNRTTTEKKKKKKNSSSRSRSSNEANGSNSSKNDFRQPTSKFLSVGFPNGVMALTDESCYRASELAKKYFPALMSVMREVNGMNVKILALRPSYAYAQQHQESAARRLTADEVISMSNRTRRKPKRYAVSDALYTVYICLVKDVDCEASDIGVEAELLGEPTQKMPLEVGEVVCVNSAAKSRIFNAGEAVLQYNENGDDDVSDYENDDDDDEYVKNIFSKAGKGCVVLAFDMLESKFERNGTAIGVAKCVEEMTRVFGNEKSTALERFIASVRCNLS